jgi:hypothetical protein
MSKKKDRLKYNVYMKNNKGDLTVLKVIWANDDLDFEKKLMERTGKKVSEIDVLIVERTGKDD